MNSLFSFAGHSFIINSPVPIILLLLLCASQDAVDILKKKKRMTCNR